MSMLDVHRDALQSVSEAYHKLLLKYQKDRKIVYGIVEGKDDPLYYISIFERFLPDNWNVDLIVAGGRKKVLDAFKMVDWNSMPERRICFFIDRDLTAYLENQAELVRNIYVTDGYSIENSIVTVDVYFRILLEAYNVVDLTDDEKDALSELFSDNLRLFTEAMTPIMAQILGWRRDGLDANLNNINIDPIFEFVDGKLSVSPSFEDECERVRHLCSGVGGSQYDDTKLSELKALFLSNRDPSNFIRGKYMIWFLSKTVAKIHQCVYLYVSAYARPPKIKISIGKENIMVIAAPRARIPSSLRTFIENNYIKFISDTKIS
jgi:hypothetical protein